MPEIILESNEQCEFYAGMSELFDGNLLQVQRAFPGELICESN